MTLNFHSLFLFPFAQALATGFLSPASEPSPQSIGDCGLQWWEQLLWPQEDVIFSPNYAIPSIDVLGQVA